MERFRVWRILAIVMAGVCLGLAWNALGGRGFALSSNVLVKPGDETIPAAEAKRRLEAGALVLDARPKMNYDVEHVPGALSLPEEEFDAAWARLEPRVRDSLDVVVYCAGFGCEASHVVARKLKERGVPAVILDEGWPAWTDAGYPVRTGPQP
jgi:rhodanese-related sulfurtransferase